MDPILQTKTIIYYIKRIENKDYKILRFFHFYSKLDKKSRQYTFKLFYVLFDIKKSFEKNHLFSN